MFGAKSLASYRRYSHNRVQGEAKGPSPRGGQTDMESIHNFDAGDDSTHELHWMEDFDDLSVDELRELPHHLQLGMDLSVYE